MGITENLRRSLLNILMNNQLNLSLRHIIVTLQWLIRLPAIVAIDLNWLYKGDKWKHMMEVDVGR